MNYETFKLRAMHLAKHSTSGDDAKFLNALNQFRIVKTDKVKTAATDGFLILVNEEFFETLSYEEQRGLLLHEIMHCRMDHPRRFKASVFTDQKQANIAMDFEINSIFKNRNWQLPQGSLYPEKHGLDSLMSWEWYNIQLKENPDIQGDDDSQNGDDSQDGDGSRDGDDSQVTVGDGCHAAGSLVDEFAPESKADLDVDEQIEAIQETEMPVVFEDVAESYEQNASANSIGNSHVTTGKPAEDGELIAVPDHKRWQDLVIDTFRSDGDEKRNDWSRRSRRSRQQLNSFMPRAKRVNGLSLALIVDASGSCTNWFDLWRSLANELVDECSAINRLEIITHDTMLMDHIEWNRGEGPVDLPLKHGGGTCHRYVIPYANDLDVDGIVLFTDNQTYWPEENPDCLVLTVMCPNSRKDYLCPFGPNVMAQV